MDTESPVPDGGAPPAAPVSAPPDAGAPPSPAWHEGIITKDAAGAESLRPYAEWQDKAPEPLRKFINDNMTAARAKTEGMVKVPGAESAPEEWDAFYKAAGRPEKPEDYKLEKPETMPEGVDWDDAAVKRFAPVAHKLGLTPAQVKELSAFQIGEVGARSAAVREAMAKQIEAEGVELKKTFGEGLAGSCALAQLAASDAGISRDKFDPTSGEFWGVEALKLVSKMQAKLQKMGAEDRGSNKGQSSVTGGYEYAKQVMNRLHPDSEIYFGRQDNPKYAEVKARVDAGYKQAPALP